MELKPCPFCGSNSVSVECLEELYMVMCSGCFAAGPSVHSETGTRSEAAELWNRRPSTEPNQSWLHEAVERVLAYATAQVPDIEKQRLREAVGLELARAHARARHELRSKR